MLPFWATPDDFCSLFSQLLMTHVPFFGSSLLHMLPFWAAPDYCHVSLFRQLLRTRVPLFKECLDLSVLQGASLNSWFLCLGSPLRHFRNRPQNIRAAGGESYSPVIHCTLGSGKAFNLHHIFVQ
jgi:hypothetical protein